MGSRRSLTIRAITAAPGCWHGEPSWTPHRGCLPTQRPLPRRAGPPECERLGYAFLTQRRSVRDQDIHAFGDEVPLVQQGLAPRQVEAPAIKPGLPVKGTAADSEGGALETALWGRGQPGQGPCCSPCPPLPSSALNSHSTCVPHMPLVGSLAGEELLGFPEVTPVTLASPERGSPSLATRTSDSSMHVQRP